LHEQEQEMGKNSGLTIADIARMANVSKSTVSRALNDSSLIGTATKERIQVIARENNFCLNVAAQSLSLKKSGVIGFVTQCYYEDFSVADLFGFEIMGGITNALYAKGYNLLMLQINPHDTEWVHQYLDTGRVDGFILMTSNRKQHHIRALLDTNAPFIMWGVPWPDLGCCSVTGDNFNGGKIATRFLIDSGRQKIAFLGGPADELEVQHRFKGYQAALQQAGRSVDADLVANGDYSISSGASAMQELLNKVPDLDAVFVNSDLMAISAMETIRAHGRRVPEDVAVVGYDDLSIAKLSNPPLTTVRQNVSKAGKLLADNLIHYLETGIVSNVTVPVELVKRQSA
jgi:DNA-binding LacI/PurR family transcriptional regulator